MNHVAHGNYGLALGLGKRHVGRGFDGGWGRGLKPFYDGRSRSRESFVETGLAASLTRGAKERDKHCLYGEKRLRGDRILIVPGYAFLESDRNVTPNLYSQDNCGCEQQRSDGDVKYRRDDHGQLGLRGVSAPHHASDEGEKAEAELCNHQAEHGDGGTAHGLHL